MIGQIEDELNLPKGWLNDSAAKFVTHRSDGPLIFQAPGIFVRHATDLQLLGMKLGLSRRNTDLDDQNVLFNAIIADLQPKSSDELWSRVAKYVPTERIESAKLKLIMMWSQR